MSEDKVEEVGRSVPDGLLPTVEPVPVSPLRAAIPSAGATSLTTLGVDHFYSPDEWEATYAAADAYEIGEWIVDGDGYGQGCEIATLINGPKLFAGHYPIGWVDDSDPGDIDDWEVRFYESRDHWKRAVASAIESRRAETQGGSVADESATRQGGA